MKFSDFFTTLFLTVFSLLAAACNSAPTLDQTYGMTSADFALGGAERSIFSSHNF